MIQELIDFQTKLANGDLNVKPGSPEKISEASSFGDWCAQGDLYLQITDKIPENYNKISPKEIDKQLVPGNTKGSKHCLDHLDVEYYLPPNFSRENYEDSLGPVIKFNSENCLRHEEHGDITIPAGFTIEFRYQNNWDLEQQKIRRAQD